MLLESSIMLLENIYSTGATHDDHHFWSSYFYSTGDMFRKVRSAAYEHYGIAHKDTFLKVSPVV